LPDDGGLAPAAGIHVTVHAVVGEVQAATREPRGPLDAARGVEHARVSRAPAQAEILDNGVPVPLEVGDRAALQLFQCGDAVRLHEPRDARLLEMLLARPPDDAVRAHGALF